MNHDHLQTTFKNSVSLKLLQSTNAPLIISFLHHQFKQAQRVTIPFAALAEKLEDYLEGLNEIEDVHYANTAENYLKIWCDDDHQFLRRYHDNDRERTVVVELTPGSEKAMGWLEELQQSEFVGTESRFLRIFDLLQEIVAKSTEDPQERLAQLETQQAALQAEIDLIQQTGEVERYTDTQIKERFFEANDTARRLLADFREVEQNFRQVKEAIEKKRLTAGVRKGALVAYVLDADEALKESDQGRSFYAFWDFLMSPTKQGELRQLLTKIYTLPELQAITATSPLLRQIKSDLIRAGEKIIRSNQRLAAQLRKILDDQYLAESRRVMALVADIKRLALAVADDSPPDEIGLEMEGMPAINLVMERPLWEKPDVPDFQIYDLMVEDEVIEAVDLAPLYEQFYVDEWTLIEHIDKLLANHPQVTLAEVSRHYPIEKGLSEIVTYLAIASKDARHEINYADQERLTYQPDSEAETIQQIRLPQVIFKR